MGFNILVHIYSALFVVSLIVLFELILVLKKNKSLKTILIGYTSGVLWYSASHLYCSYYGYNRILLELPFPLLSICFMTLFSTLCYNKVKNYVVIFSAISLLNYLAFVIYFIFIKPVDVGIPLSDKNVLGDYVSYIKLLYLIVFLVISGSLYFKMQSKYQADNIYFKRIKNWACFFIVGVVFIFISGINRVFNGYSNEISRYLNSLVLFLTIIALLFRPKFLNTSKLSISLSNYFTKTPNSEIDHITFNEAFYDNLYFLNADASMDDLSKKLKVSSETLYRYIYKNYKSGFNDLVNENRVKYFIDIVKSKKHKNYTIDALSQLAGFSSRHHLYKPFKKFHGGVPSDFMKSLDYM
jgi:AraC-like DNA-binding protein